MAGNRVEGGTARAVLDYITRSIATDPDAVVLEADDSGRTCGSVSTWPSGTWAA